MLDYVAVFRSAYEAAADPRVHLIGRRGWLKAGPRCVRLSSIRDRFVVIIDTCAVRDSKRKSYPVAALKYDAAYLVGAVQARAKRFF